MNFVFEQKNSRNKIMKKKTSSRTRFNKLSAASRTLFEAGCGVLLSFRIGGSDAFAWDFDPDIPNSTTSKTVASVSWHTF